MFRAENLLRLSVLSFFASRLHAINTKTRRRMKIKIFAAIQISLFNHRTAPHMFRVYSSIIIVRGKCIFKA